jgi:hypothetical protein
MEGLLLSIVYFQDLLQNGTELDYTPLYRINQEKIEYFKTLDFFGGQTATSDEDYVLILMLSTAFIDMKKYPNIFIQEASKAHEGFMPFYTFGNNINTALKNNTDNYNKVINVSDDILFLIAQSVYIAEYSNETSKDVTVGVIDFSNSGIDLVISPDKPELVTHVQEDMLLTYDSQILMNVNLGMNVASSTGDITFEDNVPSNAREYILSDIRSFANMTSNETVELNGVTNLTMLSTLIKHALTKAGGITDNILNEILGEVDRIYKNSGSIFNLGKEKAIKLINDIVKTIVPTDAYTTTHVVSIGEAEHTLSLTNIDSILTQDRLQVVTSADVTPSLVIKVKNHDTSDDTYEKSISLASRASISSSSFSGLLINNSFKLSNTSLLTYSILADMKFTKIKGDEDSFSITLPTQDEVSVYNIGKLKERTVVNLNYLDYKLLVDFSKTPILSEIISFINQFLSTKDNGQEFPDEVDAFLNNCNEVISNMTGCTINSMTKFFDNMNDMISTQANYISTDMLNEIRSLNNYVRSLYSDTSLDFAAHLMGNLFDQLDSPQTMMKVIADDINSMIESSDIKFSDVTRLLYIENMTAIASKSFEELVTTIKGIASVPILSAFKQSITTLTSGADGIITMYKNITSAVSSIEQQFSSFDFFPFDNFDKLTNLDIMDITNLMNKLYRVIGHNLLTEFHTVISAIANLDLDVSDNIERLKLIISGHFSTLIGNISDSINSTAEDLNNYLSDLLPNLLALIPRLIQTLAEVSFSIISTIASKLGSVIQGIFDLASDYEVNTSSSATVDNPEGSALITIKNSEVETACSAIKEKNNGIDLCLQFTDKTKSVTYLLDTGLKSVSIFADCVNGKLIRILSFTNVSKYKGYESIARSSRLSYPDDVIAKLDKLAIAEETIKTLSILDQGPK